MVQKNHLTENHSLVVIDFAARTRKTRVDLYITVSIPKVGNSKANISCSLTMSRHHQVTAAVPHFRTKDRTVESRRTIVMLISSWLEQARKRAIGTQN